MTDDKYDEKGLKITLATCKQIEVMTEEEIKRYMVALKGMIDEINNEIYYLNYVKE